MKAFPAKIQMLYEEDVISSVEAEFVRFLLSQNPEENDQVLLAAAACVHAQMNGHVCLDLESSQNQYLFNDERSEILLSDIKQKWGDTLQQSKLVGRGSELKPLVFQENRLYLHRYWKYEQELAEWLKSKASVTSQVSDKAKQAIRLFLKENANGVDWQDVALILSFMRELLVITGGPGTGKTFTVLKIIAAQNHFKDGKLKVAVAAPTGKASRRLTESIHAGKQDLPKEIREKINIPEDALTVHKLLGSDYEGIRFKYNSENKLPYDLVIVDEASMLDVNLWVNLIRAIPEHGKLIVLGDKDQLASVEAGSILGDICGGENSFSAEISAAVTELSGAEIPVSDSAPGMNDSVVFLTKSYRFGEDSGIKRLAEAINSSDDDLVMELLKGEKYPEIKLHDSSRENLNQVIQKYAVQHFEKFSAKTIEDHLSSSNQKKILCVLRRGDFGVEKINSSAEQKIKLKQPASGHREWYPGRIIMATRNDPVLKIRNGEIGICTEAADPQVIFEGENKLPISAGRIKDYEPAYAITIHKSQGSEFEDVAIILPETMNKVLSKEILYTSVTRARRSTLVIGNEKIIRKTVLKSIARGSGLRQLIWE